MTFKKTVFTAISAVALLAGGTMTLAALGGADATAQAQSAKSCLLYTSPSPRDGATSRMPSSA